MKKYLHTLHSLDAEKPEAEGEFDADEFSRFKYGEGTIAYDYAERMARLLSHSLQKDVHYFLTGSAYQDIPTAAVTIAYALAKYLNETGFKVTYAPLRGKAHTYDYSNMTFEDREKITNKNQLKFDTQAKIKKVIVVDDIRVTGLHEYAIERFLHEKGVIEAHFVYTAVLNEGVKETDPCVEWRLNHTYVNSLDKLLEIMRPDSFCPNARICKFLLSADLHALKRFLPIAPLNKVQDLVHFIRLEGYNTVADYRVNFELLEKSVPSKPLEAKYPLAPPLEARLSSIQ